MRPREFSSYPAVRTNRSMRGIAPFLVLAGVLIYMLSILAFYSSVVGFFPQKGLELWPLSLGLTNHSNSSKTVSTKSDVELNYADQSYRPHRGTGRLTRRERRRISWEDGLCRGEGLLQKLNNQEYDPAKWTFDSLHFYHYNIDTMEKPITDGDEYDNILESHGLPKLTHWFWLQAITWGNEGPPEERIDGGAMFDMYYAPSYGAAIISQAYTPDDPMPNKLSRLSDVAWLAWEHVCNAKGADPSGLKYIVRKSIYNEDSIAIVNRAWGNRDESRVPDSREFTMSTEEGKAILGSPNGIACAWMILNHPDVMRGKTIEKVTSHKDSTSKDHLVFHVKDLS